MDYISIKRYQKNGESQRGGFKFYAEMAVFPVQ